MIIYFIHPKIILTQLSNNDISHIGELIFNNIDVIKEDCLQSAE